MSLAIKDGAIIVYEGYLGVGTNCCCKASSSSSSSSGSSSSSSDSSSSSSDSSSSSSDSSSSASSSGSSSSDSSSASSASSSASSSDSDSSSSGSSSSSSSSSAPECVTDADCGCVEAGYTYYAGMDALFPGQGCCPPGHVFEPSLSACSSDGTALGVSASGESKRCCDGECLEVVQYPQGGCQAGERECPLGCCPDATHVCCPDGFNCAPCLGDCPPSEENPLP